MSEINYISTITIGGDEIPVKNTELNHELLKFYPENPRIYSFLNFDGSEPSQREIEEKIIVMDHVSELVASIKANGGIVDPILVRDGDYVVLEGNSRLAAYRKLSRQDPIKWAKIKCALLPKDISEAAIFTLLGQYHIIGRKDWNPYEQAGYLWRRNKHYNISIEQMVGETGLSGREIRKLISVYDFMKVNNDNTPSKWSYYYEYLKSQRIKKIREEFEELDKVVVEQIKTGRITAAIDIREKLEPIAKVPGKKGSKIIKKYISGKKTLDECFDEAEATGINNNIYQKLYKFRCYIAMPDRKKDVKLQEKALVDKCKYELNSIKKAVDRILLEIDKNSKD